MTLSGSHQTKSDVTLADQLNALLSVQTENGYVAEGAGGRITSDPVAYFTRKIPQLKQKLEYPTSTKYKSGLTKSGSDKWKLKITLYNKPYYPLGKAPAGGFYVGNKEWMTKLVETFEALANDGHLTEELNEHHRKYGPKPVTH